MRTPGMVTLFAVTMLLAACAADAEPPAGPAPAEPWAWELLQCPGYEPESYPAAAYRASAQRVADAEMVVQVDSYQPGWGRAAFAEIESVLAACAQYEHGGSGDPAAFLEQHLIVGRELTGDASLLVETIRLRPPAQERWCSTVVLDGDRVMTVRVAQSAEAAGSCVAVAGPARAALRGLTTGPPQATGR